MSRRFPARILLLALTVLVTPFVDACRARPQPGPSLPAARPSPIAAVLTTDCGVEMDDQWALTHLLLSPEIDLRAIVTTHASTTGFSSAESAKEAAGVVSRVRPQSSDAGPQVIAGSPSPLPDASTPRPNPGVDLLLRLSRDYSASRRLVVFVTGAATDVASALLQDRTLADRVTVVAMGFEDWPHGGDEFNIKNDPSAWRAILDSDVPVVVGSSTLTKRELRLTRTEARQLMQGRGSLGAYLYGLFEKWVTEQASLVAQMVGPDTWVVWDEVVVAFALGMARGDEMPRPQLQLNMVFTHPKTTRRITWLTDVDTERVWQDFTRKVDLRRGS